MITEYLTGEKINEQYIYNCNEHINTEKRWESKSGFFEDKCKAKKVLHIGFCDHVHLIDEKIEDGTWLHDTLCKSAGLCVGVDINETAIKHIAKKGYEDVHCMDVTHKETADFLLQKYGMFDYVVIPDVIEHLNDPIGFLGAFRENFSTGFRRAIVSVPNALSMQSFFNAVKQKEIINTDHRYCFSPYTLTKVLCLAGFRVVNIDMIGSMPVRFGVKWPWHMVKRRILAKSPLTRGLIVSEIECIKD